MLSFFIVSFVVFFVISFVLIYQLIKTEKQLDVEKTKIEAIIMDAPRAFKQDQPKTGVVLNWFKRLILPAAFDAARQGLKEVKPDFLGSYLSERVDLIEEITELLIDTDKDNTEQLKQYFKDTWQVQALDALNLCKDLIHNYATPKEKEEWQSIIQSKFKIVSTNK